MERGFLGYAVALALAMALVSAHAIQTRHNQDVVETRLAMLEHQAITNKGEMVEATFCQVDDYESWEKWLLTQGVSLECGDIGPVYYKSEGQECDWSMVKPLPNGKYLSGGEHYGVLARIAIGNSRGLHVIRSGKVCEGK